MIKDYKQIEFLGKGIFRKVVLKPPFRVMGKMPDEVCFFYMIEGKSNWLAYNEKLEVQEKDGVVMKCGTYINEFVNHQGYEYCEAVAIHFYPEVLKNIYEKELPEFLTKPQPVPASSFEHIPTGKLLENYIESLQYYFENPELVNEDLIKLKLKEIVLLLHKTNKLGIISELISGIFDPKDVEFKEVIETHLYNNLKLDELAALCGLSLSTFKREFVKQYQSSPAKYIKKRRLERSTELLKYSNLRVSDIAYDTGFQDLAHFSKSFLKEYGCPPTIYRLNHTDKSLAATNN